MLGGAVAGVPPPVPPIGVPSVGILPKIGFNTAPLPLPQKSITFA